MLAGTHSNISTTRAKLDIYKDLDLINISMDKVNLSGRDKYKGRWDGKNFSFERDRSYGFSWPQRNYNCNFCKKEFKSAQALGGHMNVHRRDRAKQLIQHSSSSSSSEINNTTTPHLIQYSNPNPKPNLNHDHKLLLNSPPHASSPKTAAAAAAAAPAAPRFFAYNHAVSDQVDALAVSPQIRKKLAVEADSRNEQFKGTMKRDINIDHESRVHKKKNNQLLGFDLNMTSTTDIRHGKDDLDLELRLGSF